jgi:hypothetical protein
VIGRAYLIGVGHRQRTAPADRGRAAARPVHHVTEQPELGGVRGRAVVRAQFREARHDRTHTCLVWLGQTRAVRLGTAGGRNLLL